MLFPDQRKLVVDDFFELGLGLGSVQEDAIDEETRRAGDSNLDAFLQVLFNLGLELPAGQTRLKRFFIQSDGLSVGKQVGLF